MTYLSQEKNFNGKTFSLQEFSRKMIDALIKRPLTRGEINRIMNEAYPYEKPNTNVVRVRRILDDLIAFDLIYNDEESEKYVWKIKAKNHIDMVEHSHQFIPVMKNLAGMDEGRYTITSQVPAYIGTENMNFLVSCFENHMLSYPDVWLILKNYRKGNRKIEGIREKFIARLKLNLSNFLAKNSMIESDSNLGIIPDLIYEHLRYGDSNIIDTISGSLAEFIERETGETSNLFEIKRIEEIQVDVDENMKKFRNKMRVMIYGIKAKRALSGGCKICAETDKPPDRYSLTNF